MEGTFGVSSKPGKACSLVMAAVQRGIDGEGEMDRERRTSWDEREKPEQGRDHARLGNVK